MPIGIIKKDTTQLHHNVVVTDSGKLDIKIDASIYVRTEIWTKQRINDHINVGYDTSSLYCSMITGSGMEGTYNEAIAECKRI